ncbi:MAG: tetratricopeptide repeat protein [Terriglobales bacterium]|jgi:tetratricopeptide (TPR) repeat protein
MATTATKLARKPALQQGLFSSAGNRRAVLSLLLILLTLGAYNPAAYNDFVSFDDPAYVTSNPHVRAGLTWDTVKWAFRSTEQANWHPLTWLSHALDCQFFHLNPAGHHYTNVLLHAATAVLLFLFLQAATGFAWRSAMVAALFAIHPVNVESVAWAAERKNVLCMFFFVLMLLAYRWYAQRPGWKRYSLVALLFAMGLMSKPMLVTVPFLLLLLDYWPMGRTKEHSLGRLVAEKLPLLAMSAASSVVTIIAQEADGAIHSSDFTLSNRLQNAILSYARYVGKAIWPSDLAAFYPHRQHLPAWQVALAALLLVSITSAVLLFGRKQQYLAVGWFWFLGAMVPVIGLVQAGEQGMADRYAYLPFVGLFLAIIWAFSEWAREHRISAMYIAVTAFCVLGALMAVTHKQIGYWKNTRSLWAHTLSITDDNYVAEASMGAELVAEGEIQEAIKHLEAGIAINPRDPFSWLDLGVCEKRLGNVDQAVEDYEAALRLASDPSLRRAAYRNLGSIYRIQKDYVRASRSYESVLQILPDDFVGLTGLGLIAQKTGDLPHAIDYYSQAVKTEPSDAEYLLLGQALAKAGRASEAQAAYAQAHKISSDWNATERAVDHLLQE